MLQKIVIRLLIVLVLFTVVSVEKSITGLDLSISVQIAEANTFERVIAYLNPINWMRHGLYIFVLTIGYLVGLLGYFFDTAVTWYIIEFGENYKNSGTGFAVETIWITVRDVLNISFIFGIIYIGFRLILDSSSSQAKSTLVSLLAAALLVNFSLFITKFIIDFANITAATIYDQTELGTSGGIGLNFINQVGLPSTLNNTSLLSGVEGDSNDWRPFSYSLGLLMLFIVTGFVFVAGAVLILIRYYALLLYMMFSPLMFLGWIFPNFGHISTKWWQGFLGKAFFAPAFMFMIYLSFMIIKNFRNRVDIANNNLGDMFNQATPSGSAGEAFAFFGLASASMLFAVIVANKMGATGATTAIAWGKRTLQGAAGGITRGTLDRTGAFGRAVSTYTPLRDISDRAVKNSVWSGADRKRRSTEIATRTADKKVQSEIAKHAKNAHDNKDNEVALTTAVRGASSAQLISSLRSAGAGTKAHENIVNAMTHEQRKKILESKDDEFKAHEKSAVATQAENQILSRISKIGVGGSAKLTVKEIDTLGRKWIHDNIYKLSRSQVEELSKSSNSLAETEKTTLMDDWKQGMKNVAVNSMAKKEDFEEMLKNRGVKDIAALPIEILHRSEATPYISNEVLREIAPKLSRHDKDKIENNLKKHTETDAEVINKINKAIGYFNTSHALEHWYDPEQNVGKIKQKNNSQDADEKRKEMAERLRNRNRQKKRL